jgi:hypothetical protein
MNQSREAHLAARPLHPPRGLGTARWRGTRPSLQVVADHERLSAVRTAGRAADQTSQGRGRRILD